MTASEVMRVGRAVPPAGLMGLTVLAVWKVRETASTVSPFRTASTVRTVSTVSTASTVSPMSPAGTARPARPTRFTSEAVIPSHRHASLAYAEGFVAEDDVLVSARREARRLGIVPVEPGTGAALRLLAATLGARAVVEVGSGAGVSGVYLLRGMRPEGVLTTVDEDSQGSQAARRAYREAGFASGRTRVIGRASCRERV